MNLSSVLQDTGGFLREGGNEKHTDAAKHFTVMAIDRKLTKRNYIKI